MCEKLNLCNLNTCLLKTKILVLMYDKLNMCYLNTCLFKAMVSSLDRFHCIFMKVIEIVVH